jgi:hypothetical protein
MDTRCNTCFTRIKLINRRDYDDNPDKALEASSNASRGGRRRAATIYIPHREFKVFQMD